MGDDAIGAMFYAIKGSDEEIKPLGKIADIEIPKVDSREIIKNNIPILTGGHSAEISIIPKTITKKRFIKLLMSMNHQRNEANIMHEEYMKMNKFRTELGMIFFEAFYKVEPKLKLKIGDEEFDVKSIKADNM